VCVTAHARAFVRVWVGKEARPVAPMAWSSSVVVGVVGLPVKGALENCTLRWAASGSGIGEFVPPPCLSSLISCFPPPLLCTVRFSITDGTHKYDTGQGHARSRPRTTEDCSQAIAGRGPLRVSGTWDGDGRDRVQESESGKGT
jgi:hypothetical protein